MLPHYKAGSSTETGGMGTGLETRSAPSTRVTPLSKWKDLLCKGRAGIREQTKAKSHRILNRESGFVCVWTEGTFEEWGDSMTSVRRLRYLGIWYNDKLHLLLRFRTNHSLYHTPHAVLVTVRSSLVATVILHICEYIPLHTFSCRLSRTFLQCARTSPGPWAEMLSWRLNLINGQ